MTSSTYLKIPTACVCSTASSHRSWWNQRAWLRSRLWCVLFVCFVVLHEEKESELSCVLLFRRASFTHLSACSFIDSCDLSHSHNADGHDCHLTRWVRPFYMPDTNRCVSDESALKCLGLVDCSLRCLLTCVSAASFNHGLLSLCALSLL